MTAVIASERYTSPQYLRAELEHLWPRVWLAAGLARDLGAEGSYCTFEIGAESILVVRQAQGLAAFHNVCLHRGRRLRDPGRGRARAFACPYHGWEWGLDGCLQHVPDADSFPGGVPAGSRRLAPVACAEWAGFVWVCLTPDPPPLLDYLGPIAPLIAAYRLEDYTLVEDLTLDVPCNWKVNVDAFNEAYHLHAVHPDLLGMVDDRHVRADLLGRHGRLIVPFFVPSARRADRETVDQALRWMAQQAGLAPAALPASALAVREAVQAHIRARERAGELDCTGLTDDQLTDSHHFHVFPNFQLDLYSLSMLALRSRPHPTDPGRMLLDQQRFERLARHTPPAPRPAHQAFAFGAGSLGTVTDQDMQNLVRVQQGLQSRGLTQIVVGEQEVLVRHLHDTLDRYVPWP